MSNENYNEFYEGYNVLTNPDDLKSRWKALEKSIQSTSNINSLYRTREIIMINLERKPFNRRLKNLVNIVNKKIAKSSKG